MLINGGIIDSTIINGTSLSSQFENISASFISFETSNAVLKKNISIIDSLISTSSINTEFIYNLFEGINLSGNLSAKTVITLLENIILLENSITSMSLKNSVLEIISFLDFSKILLSEDISSGLIINSTLTEIRDVLANISESLLLDDSTTSKLVGKSSIIEALTLVDIARFNLINISVSESLLLNSISLILLKAFNDTIESIALSSNLVDSRGIGVILNSSLIVSNTLNNKISAKAILEEDLIFIIPTGNLPKDYSTFVYTPETSSVTTYTNYNFDGCTKFDDKYLFFNSTGLYEFGGKTDNLESILANIITPAYSFNTSNLKQVPSIYLGVSTDDVVYLKVRVDGKAEAVYKLNKKTDNLETLKLSIGKGLIGRYFQFELETEAPVFDLESIEFFPIQFQRKL